MRLEHGLPTPYRFFQSRELRLSIAVPKGEVGSFPQYIALCEDSKLGMASLILDNDCVFVFTELLLPVEGPEVFVGLSFERVVVVADVGQ